MLLGRRTCPDYRLKTDLTTCLPFYLCPIPTPAPLLFPFTNSSIVSSLSYILFSVTYLHSAHQRSNKQQTKRLPRTVRFGQAWYSPPRFFRIYLHGGAWRHAQATDRVAGSSPQLKTVLVSLVLCRAAAVGPQTRLRVQLGVSVQLFVRHMVHVSRFLMHFIFQASVL